MRVISKFAVAGAVAATLAGVGFGAAGPAMADPPSTPSLPTLTGVGTDTLTPLFDQGGTTTNDPGCTSSTPGDPGTFVTDYNATPPTYPVASWDALNPCTFVPAQPITTKALNSGDTSCNLTRPDGSGEGIVALNANQTDTNLWNGQTVYCIDYARSARPPNPGTEDAFVALAQDALAWSYPKLKGKTNPQPKSLTLAQLVDIYDCTITNWNQVGGKNAPIGVVLPQPGTDTRSNWLLDLKFTALSEPCWQNGTIIVNKISYVINEDTGRTTGNVAQFTKKQKFGSTCATGCAPQDDIFPYSIGDWIAQTTPAVDGVGGHATAVWGHGNLHLGQIVGNAPVTKNASGQPVINPAWDPQFVYTLYGVTRNGCAGVCLPQSPAYPTYEVTGLAALFGPPGTGWICTSATAQADIVSYGFTGLGAGCGALTAGDWP